MQTTADATEQDIVAGCDEEREIYYERPLTEGNRKMSCVNIIRAKLVSRMSAAAKRQTTYYEIAA